MKKIFFILICCFSFLPYSNAQLFGYGQLEMCDLKENTSYVIKYFKSPKNITYLDTLDADGNQYIPSDSVELGFCKNQSTIEIDTLQFSNMVAELDSLKMCLDVSLDNDSINNSLIDSLKLELQNIYGFLGDSTLNVNFDSLNFDDLISELDSLKMCLDISLENDSINISLIDSLKLELQNISNILLDSAINVVIDSLNFGDLIAELDSLKMCLDLGNSIDSMNNDVLDSINNNLMVKPDSCICQYRIDQRNWTYTPIDNSTDIEIGFDNVVFEDCGCGEAEIYNNRETQIETNFVVRNGIGNGNDYPFRQNGFYDFIELNTDNPLGTLVVDLNPNSLNTTYPNFVGAPASNFIYDTANPNQFRNSIKLLIDHAIEKWRTDNNLQPVNYTLLTYFTQQGILVIDFKVVHNPSDPFVSVSPLNNIRYFPEGVIPRTPKITTLVNFFNRRIDSKYNELCNNLEANYLVTKLLETGVGDWNTLTTTTDPPDLVEVDNTECVSYSCCGQEEDCCIDTTLHDLVRELIDQGERYDSLECCDYGLGIFDPPINSNDCTIGGLGVRRYYTGVYIDGNLIPFPSRILVPGFGNSNPNFTNEIYSTLNGLGLETNGDFIFSRGINGLCFNFEGFEIRQYCVDVNGNENDEVVSIDFRTGSQVNCQLTITDNQSGACCEEIPLHTVSISEVPICITGQNAVKATTVLSDGTTSISYYTEVGQITGTPNYSLGYCSSTSTLSEANTNYATAATVFPNDIIPSTSNYPVPPSTREIIIDNITGSDLVVSTSQGTTFVPRYGTRILTQPFSTIINHPPFSNNLTVQFLSNVGAPTGTDNPSLLISFKSY